MKKLIIIVITLLWNYFERIIYSEKSCNHEIRISFMYSLSVMTSPLGCPRLTYNLARVLSLWQTSQENFLTRGMEAAEPWLNLDGVFLESQLGCTVCIVKFIQCLHCINSPVYTYTFFYFYFSAGLSVCQSDGLSVCCKVPLMSSGGGSIT
jgi:hypothetical protein